MPITALPTPPSRDDPANFSSRADAFLGALPAFGTEANALATDVNAAKVAAELAETNAEAANTLAQAAKVAAELAETNAEIAQAAAEAAVASIPAGSINDTTTTTNSVWSSSKVSTELVTKQSTLVSGINIKTVGGVSVLGSGDIAIPTAITPLGVVTGTNVATLDITGLDTWGATYDRILIMGKVATVTDANGALRALLQMGGIWVNSSYQYFREVGTTAAASLTFTNSTSTTFVPIMDGSRDLDTWRSDLTINVFRPDVNRVFDWEVSGESVGTGVGVPGTVRGMATRTGGATQIQGIRLYAATGNVTGTFRVYGIKNS